MELLTGVIEQAGNPNLIMKELLSTLVDHSHQITKFLSVTGSKKVVGAQGLEPWILRL